MMNLQFWMGVSGGEPNIFRLYRSLSVWVWAWIFDKSLRSIIQEWDQWSVLAVQCIYTVSVQLYSVHTAHPLFYIYRHTFSTKNIV